MVDTKRRSLCLAAEFFRELIEFFLVARFGFGGGFLGLALLGLFLEAFAQ